MRPLLILGAVVGCVEEQNAALGFACGLGTVEIDGTCEAERAAVEEPIPSCSDEQVFRDGRCADPSGALAWLPFAAGATVRIGQGYHGALSHTGMNAWALDFQAPVGTPVHAIRPGRVYSLSEDSDAGCGDPSCAPLANSVVIDHGDGTFASYLHLSLDGVLVEEGDTVAQGQPIALSGNTGFSTGPHLHLQVRDILGYSQPVVFAEFLDSTGGVAFGGAPVSSENEELAPPDDAAWSSCPTDLFAWLGVMLDPGTSCGRVEETTLISGEVAIEGAAAVVTVLQDGALERICAPPGAWFAIEVPWAELGGSGAALFTVSAADPETCQGYRPSSAAAQVQVE